MKPLIKKLIFFLIFLMFTSCHEKDYDVVEAIFNIKKENKTPTKEKKNTDNKLLKKPVEEKFITEDTEVKLKEKNLKSAKSIKSRIIKEKKANINKDAYKPNFTYGFNEDNSNLIKIGVLLPLSGKDADIGNMILHALELAIFQNKGSFIELIIKDSQIEPNAEKMVFKQLLESNTRFIIGPLFSKTLISINEQILADRINIFSLSNNKSLSKKGVWIFGIDPKEQTERILDYVIEKGIENTAALLPQNAYGLLLFETITNYANEKKIKQLRVEFYEDNIKSQQSAAKKLAKGFDEYEIYLKKLDTEERQENEILKEVKRPFDNVIIAASGQALTVLASQLQYNNVDPKKVQFLGTSSWEDQGILNEPALEGGVFATTSQLFQKDIKRIYKNTFNKEMPKVAMIAYDILALLISTEKEKKKIDIKDLTNKQGFLGLRGLFRLSENGTVERSFDLKTIKNKQFIIHEKAKNFF